jgi:hypothetical protein
MAAGGEWPSILADLTEQIDDLVKIKGVNFPYHPGWAKTGYFRWKPELMLKRLRSSDVSSEDIVFYHDSDVNTRPDYLSGVESWASWVEQEMKGFDVLVFLDSHRKIQSDVKPEVRELFLGRVRGRLPLSSLWAGAFAVRNSPGGLAFVEAWTAFCGDFDLLGPQTREVRVGRFWWHSGDQALLTMLWHTRRARFKNLSKIKLVNLAKAGNSRIIPPV